MHTKIPSTGETKYFYIDPYTGNPIYVDRGSVVTTANGVSNARYASGPLECSRDQGQETV